MKITYDREVDALYTRLADTIVTTKYIEDGIALDYDAANHLAGIEILDDSAIVEFEEVAPGVVFDCNEANQALGFELLHPSSRSPELKLSTLEFVTV